MKIQHSDGPRVTSSTSCPTSKVRNIRVVGRAFGGPFKIPLDARLPRGWRDLWAKLGLVVKPFGNYGNWHSKDLTSAHSVTRADGFIQPCSGLMIATYKITRYSTGRVMEPQSMECSLLPFDVSPSYLKRFSNLNLKFHGRLRFHLNSLAFDLILTQNI